MATPPTAAADVVDAPALTRLVRDVPTFLEEVWGQQPWHVTNADRAGFEDLLSLTHVDELLSTSGLRAPAFRLVRKGTTLPTSRVTRHARVGGKPINDLVDVRAVHDEVADGATLVLQGLHRSFPPVAALCHDLEATLDHPVQANAYLTPPVSQGLNLHADPHDVFAVQTYGRKRWVVYPPGASEPWDIELAPGDVLYLPTGARHAAQTIGEPSLHLTIGIRPKRWRSIVDGVVAEALSKIEELDDPLPVAWSDDPDALDGQLAARLRLVADVLDERAQDRDARHETLRASARRRQRDRTADLRGGLIDILRLETLDDHTPLRRLHDDVEVHLEDGADDEHLVVDVGRRRLVMPAAARALVEQVIAAEQFRPADLDAYADEASRLVVCRRLVREGVLRITSPLSNDVE